MASLGELGKAPDQPVEPDTFGWFGETIRIRTGISELMMMDFAEEASQLSENDPLVMTFLKSQVREVIHVDDFPLFWSTAKANGQGSEDIMRVFSTIIAQVSERPTQPLSDSSVGRPVTTITSGVDSFSPDTDGLTDRDRRVVATMEGRPDLVLMVTASADARASERRTA